MTCACSRAMTYVKRMMAKYKIPGTVKCSTRAGKKLMLVLPNGRAVHFGYCGSHTYAEGASSQKRDAYRKRHSAIILKTGKRAIDVRLSPAYLSYHLLW
jgi:hypothetical protein